MLALLFVKYEIPSRYRIGQMYSVWIDMFRASTIDMGCDTPRHLVVIIFSWGWHPGLELSDPYPTGFSSRWNSYVPNIGLLRL